MSGFFVPHDLKAPLEGAPTGPLAGLSAVVKDMYAIAGERTGGGNPDWLANAKPATRALPRGREAARRRRDHHRQDHLRRILLQRRRHERALRHADQRARAGAHSRRLVERIGGGDRGRRLRLRARLRHRRLGPHPGFALRALRHPHHARPRRHQGRDGHGAVVRHRRLVRRDAPACSARSAPVLLGGAAVAAPIERLLDRRRRLRAGRRAGRGAAARRARARWPARCPSRSACSASRRTALDPWRDAVRIIQAHEIWQVYGRFVEAQAAALRPGRRRAHAGRREGHQAPRPTPRATCTPRRASTSAPRSRPARSWRCRPRPASRR